MNKRARKCECGRSFKPMNDGVWKNVQHTHRKAPNHKKRMAIKKRR